MSGYSPLTSDELPEHLIPVYDLSTQKVDTESGRGMAKVDRICQSCGNRKRIRVSWIRVELRRGNIRGLCRNCNRLFSGENSPNWKGGRTISGEGYVLIYRPEHPFSKSNGYVQEHRLIMEDRIGRLLLPSESVHHKNGVRSDNQPENLELRSGQHGPGFRYEDLDTSQLESLVTYLLELIESKLQ